MRFNHDLCVTLKLESDGKDVEVHSGNIEKLDLNLHSFGHQCNVHFNSFDGDEMDALFSSPKVIKATLTFKSIDPNQNEAVLLEIKGIVTDKFYQRIPSTSVDFEQAVRLYEIFFSDNSKVIWEQHFPMRIYVEESMKDVLEKHKDPEVILKYDWDALEVKHPLIAFALQHKPWLPENQQVNFYSFLMWYLHHENGLWTYDYKTHSYTISAKKKDPEGDPLTIVEWLVYPPVCQFPSAPRYHSKKIFHTSETVDGEDKEHEHAFKSAKRESFDPKHYSAFPEQSPKSSPSLLNFEQNEVDVTFAQFENKLFIDQLTPGSFVCFKGDGEGNWTRDPCFKDKTFRVRNLQFRAERVTPSEKVVSTIDNFQLFVKSKLELPEEKYGEWPRYIPPSYPFSIQGFIVSDVGDLEQSTYKLLETEKAPRGSYIVHIPLVGGEKKVVAPFTPDFMTGQHYFPLCKGEKVLLSIYFGAAKIQRTLDWQPLARLPIGVQGNQIVFGSNGKDKYTILKHEFKDGKDPVFTIKQFLETHTQEIQIKEKEIQVFVEEKDKKTISIVLNKESGLQLTLEDKDASMTQQTTFDGKSMTHICKGSSDTSIISQKPESVSIECKEFSISSEKIVFDAKDSIMQTGKNKVNIETAVANVAAPSVKLGK